jgi:hypothetical protein
MRLRRNHRRSLALAAALVGVAILPAVAAAQTKIYPPGSDCANQPTIAERLLCGRQEFRREHGLSVEQPTIVPPGSVRQPEPLPEPPMPPSQVSPTPGQEEMQPNTASPNH